MFTARAIEAEEALAIGFATEVVDDAEARVPASCASCSPATRRRRCGSPRRRCAAPRPVPDGDDLVLEAYGSEEFRARVAAFLKR